MAVILADDTFRYIFNENDKMPVLISLKFLSGSPVDNKPAWHRPGDKPLPEPMMTQFTYAYMRH